MFSTLHATIQQMKWLPTGPKKRTNQNWVQPYLFAPFQGYLIFHRRFTQRSKEINYYSGFFLQTIDALQANLFLIEVAGFHCTNCIIHPLLTTDQFWEANTFVIPLLLILEKFQNRKISLVAVSIFFRRHEYQKILQYSFNSPPLEYLIFY